MRVGRWRLFSAHFYIKHARYISDGFGYRIFLVVMVIIFWWVYIKKQRRANDKKIMTTIFTFN